MSEVSTKTCAIYDYGLFLNLAERLAQDFKKVYYFVPYKNSSPHISKFLIGTGLDKVERIHDWDRFVADDIADLYIFTDIYTSDIQYRLKAEGKLVWGCGDAEDYETDRLKFKKAMEADGLPVIPYKSYTGIEDVEEALEDEEDKYIKATYWRGDFETIKWKNKEMTMPEIEKRSLGLGMYKNMLEFIVEDHLEGIEVGVDTYSVNGQTPDKISAGIEVKNCGYFSKVIDKKDLQDGFNKTTDWMANKVDEAGSNGNFSTEVRADGKDFYLIDGTFRWGNPPSSSLQEAISNWAEIMWFGAQGIMVQPEWTCKYFCEIIINSAWIKDSPTQVFFPDKLSQFVKLRNYCKIDGKHFIVEMGDEYSSVCSCVGLGDTFAKSIKNAMSVAEEVKCIEKDAQIDCVREALDTIKKFKAHGMPAF